MFNFMIIFINPLGFSRRYKIIEELGVGTYGKVFRVKNFKENKEVGLMCSHKNSKYKIKL